MAETNTKTLEQRHKPTLQKELGQIGTGIDPATGLPSMNLNPTPLPSGTEMTYTPAAVQTAELQTTTGSQLGTSPQVTAGQVPLTSLDVTTPTAAAPGSYSATTVANSVSDANAQLGSLSQGALTAPQGTVSQQALATAAQGTSAQATAPTRVLSAAEQFDAAKLSDVGGYQSATAETMNTPQEATVQYQLQQLMSQFDNNQIPAFASGAIQHANATMLARGLGASSMAGQAILHAAMETATAVAVQDAKVHSQFNLQNLSNKQQTALVNAQLGSLSQGALTAPQGTVSQQALATAATGTSAQATSPTRVLSAEEQVNAANLASVGGYQAATAQTMNTPQEANVQYQLQQLMSQFDNNQIPAFASGAIQHANATMLARGLGASSMAGQAILHAAMETATAVAVQDAQTNVKFNLQNLSNKQQTALMNAQLRATLTGQELTNEQQTRVLNAAKVSEVNNLNFTSEQQVALENAKLMQGMKLANLNTSQQVALQNAATLAGMDTKNLDARLTAAVQNARDFLQIDMANLNNKQQAEVFNKQAKNQALLTDTASQNASAQFNASSQNQVDQFYKTLGSQVAIANKNRTAAMQQFNVDQANALAKFATQVEDSRDKFNAEMSAQIDQSNVTWRRAINTTNTAEQNRINQQNAQTLLDLSVSAQNRLWNRYRDEAEWFVNITEAREARAHQAALTAQQNNFSMDMYNDKAKDSFWMTIGGAIFDVIKDSNSSTNEKGN